MIVYEWKEKSGSTKQVDDGRCVFSSWRSDFIHKEDGHKQYWEFRQASKWIQLYLAADGWGPGQDFWEQAWPAILEI